MSKTSLPGFSAEASLYRTSQQDGRFAATLAAVTAGRGVLAQLRPRRWTYIDCIDACDREICQFDDIGDLCEACYGMCWYNYRVRATGSL